MKTVKKILLFGLACASVVNAGPKWESAKKLADSALSKQAISKSYKIHPVGLIVLSVLTKVATTGLVRAENNSTLTVGKNALKSLGGSALASLLLFIANTNNKNGLLEALFESEVMQKEKASKIAISPVTPYAANALRIVAILSYLAGQNNWNPITGLRPSALKALLTKQYSTSEQVEFLLNTLVPLLAKTSNVRQGSHLTVELQ